MQRITLKDLGNLVRSTLAFSPDEQPTTTNTTAAQRPKTTANGVVSSGESKDDVVLRRKNVNVSQQQNGKSSAGGTSGSDSGAPSATGDKQTDHYVRWVRHRVSCHHCTALLDEPRTLPCLHSFCSKCVSMLKVHVQAGTDTAGYTCPKCGEFCAQEAARKNQLLTELLALYKLLSQKGSITNCTQCRTRKPIYRCLDCKADFCEPCRKVHDGFELMRVSHRWLAHADLGKRLVVDKLLFCELHPKQPARHECLQCACLVCETCLSEPSGAHAQHSSESVEQAVRRHTRDLQAQQASLETAMATAEQAQRDIAARSGDICRSIDEQAEEARRIHRRLTERLNTDLASVLTQLDALRTAVQKESGQLSTDLTLEARKAKTATATIETTLRVAQGASLLQELHSGVLQRVTTIVDADRIGSLPKAEAINDPQPKLVPFDLRISDSNTIGHVASDKLVVKDSNLWPGSIKDLVEKTGNMTSLLRLNPAEYARTFIQMNPNELWIPFHIDDNNQIRVVTLQGEILEEKALPEAIRSTHALVLTRRRSPAFANSEIAVIGAQSGLFSITEQCNIVQILGSNPVADVCLSGGRLVALEYAPKPRIVHFLSGARGWELQGAFELQNSEESSQHDSVQVTEDRVHVACWFGDSITTYNMEGVRISQYRQAATGKSGAGKSKEKKEQKSSSSKSSKKKQGGELAMSGPRLCGRDAQGAVLVCDSGNRRLQVLLPSGSSSGAVTASATTVVPPGGLGIASTLLQGLTLDPVSVMPLGEGADGFNLLIMGKQWSGVVFSFR